MDPKIVPASLDEYLFEISAILWADLRALDLDKNAYRYDDIAISGTLSMNEICRIVDYQREHGVESNQVFLPVESDELDIKQEDQEPSKQSNS